MTTDKNIERRKSEHLDLANSDIAQNITSQFDRISLTHQALPQINMSDIDLSAQLFGKTFRAPLMIGAMTGGTQRGDRLNLALAEAAQIYDIPLALGSQRASLQARQSQSQLRRLAPLSFLIANIGALQLAQPDGLDLAKRAIDDVQANAIAIHLNPLQEAIQPEGGGDWTRIPEALERLIAHAPVPVYIKEVGAGISADTARRLHAIGCRYIEVAGRGGTNWAAIEQARVAHDRQTDYAPFLTWGIDTVDALKALEAIRCDLSDCSIIASGGIRSGLDVAKAIRLGADFTAAAYPFLAAGLDQSHTKAVDQLCLMIETWLKQMRLAMFLTSSGNLNALKHCAYVDTSGDR